MKKNSKNKKGMTLVEAVSYTHLLGKNHKGYL